ncbi:glucoamylase family protein [Aestuariivirga sp.]|uniref:glucoamylase family protein n=1 Tax=Aestuariivirga sp. TaxID=2650926 RepID=UPI0035B0F63F
MGAVSTNLLLDRVQRETLRYFTDFAHPACGMARERSGSGNMMDTVTTGGTGFGIMAMIAGAERGFLARSDLVQRVAAICRFLEAAPRHRGAFAHWMNGSSGATVAFSTRDDGGDIVETAFLMMGLITARQYLQASAPALARRIDELWRGVDWAGYCPEPNRFLWHWSETQGFGMALQLRGWHEALVAFVLGAGSPTHPIDVRAYSEGWKDSPTFRNGQVYYRIRLPLGPPMGGPLFFAHYSFMGIDPRGLGEGGIDYWAQNRAQVRINRAHCIANPHGFAGYGADCWGLTASDGPHGYEAFSPGNDKGVIAPTAALASMPYAPAAALAALRRFDSYQGGALWGDFGFRDAFCAQEGWIATSHLAINQGPIVAMIENHRSGLLWRLFMSAPEVRLGLGRLGFTRGGVTA